MDSGMSSIVYPSKFIDIDPQVFNIAGATRKPPLPKKEWEAKTLGEKVMELYVGEKGLLF